MSGTVARKQYDKGIVGLVLNISIPAIKTNGLAKVEEFLKTQKNGKCIVIDIYQLTLHYYYYYYYYIF